MLKITDGTAVSGKLRNSGAVFWVSGNAGSAPRDATQGLSVEAAAATTADAVVVAHVAHVAVAVAAAVIVVVLEENQDDKQDDDPG